MEVLGQGVVLMIAGMGFVYAFLTVLIVVTRVTMSGIAKFDSILPQGAPKKSPAARATAGDDENIALAIAVAMRG